MRHSCMIETTVPVANAVYAVWADDDETGRSVLCRWPGDNGVYRDFDRAQSLARRANADPYLVASVVAYVGKEGADLIAHQWKKEEEHYASEGYDD